MTRFTYFFLLFLSLIILLEKVYFFLSESLYQFSLLGSLELVILFGLLIWSAVAFITQSDPKTAYKTKVKEIVFSKNIKTTLLLAVGCLVVIVTSFFHNYQKIVLEWDSVALYDARAQFLLQGISFSEMSSLSEFDSQNGYYYLLYPPFTSLTHFFWYQVGVLPPISVLYSIFFLLLGIGLFLIFYPRIGIEWSLVATFLILGQQTLYSTALVAYSNLPYTLYLALGILTLHRFLVEKKMWWLCLGTVLVASSQWIRFLEPSWLAIVLGFAVISWKQLGWKKGLGTSLIVSISCLISYASWKYFTDVIGQTEVIFDTSPLFLIEPFIGIFTGSFLNMAIANLRMWGSVIVIYFGAFLATLIEIKNKELFADFFLLLVIFFSFLMYFVGLYFVSFQFDWWPEMEGSLTRSSTYLLAPAIYLVVKSIKTLLQR